MILTEQDVKVIEAIVLQRVRQAIKENSESIPGSTLKLIQQKLQAMESQLQTLHTKIDTLERKIRYK